MTFECAACGSKAGTYCVSKAGVRTKHVHSAWLKAFDALTAAGKAKAIKASADKAPAGPRASASKADTTPRTSRPPTPQRPITASG